MITATSRRTETRNYFPQPGNLTIWPAVFRMLARREVVEKNKRMTGSRFDLNCADYQVTAASVGHGRGGSTFRCTVGPLTDELFRTLDDVARTNGTLRLVFPKRPLVLERIEVKRIEPSSARISGHVVEGSV